MTRSSTTNGVSRQGVGARPMPSPIQCIEPIDYYLIVGGLLAGLVAGIVLMIREGMVL